MARPRRIADRVSATVRGSGAEKRDAEAMKLRGQVERRMQTMQDRIAREHRELVQDRSELSGRKREELLAGVETVFNFVVGKRPIYGVGFAARRRREVEAAQQDVRESEEAIVKRNANLQVVADEYKASLSQLSDKWMRVLSDVTDVPLAPKKSDIFADLRGGCAGVSGCMTLNFHAYDLSNHCKKFINQLLALCE